MTHTLSSLCPDGIHEGLVARSGSIRACLGLQPLATQSLDLSVCTHASSHL